MFTEAILEGYEGDVDWNRLRSIKKLKINLGNNFKNDFYFVCVHA